MRSLRRPLWLPRYFRDHLKPPDTPSNREARWSKSFLVAGRRRWVGLAPNGAGRSMCRAEAVDTPVQHWGGIRGS